MNETKTVEGRILNDLPEILNARNIAQYLSIGYVKALDLIKYGGIPYIKIGNTYRIPKEHFSRWLMEGKTKEIQM